MSHQRSWLAVPGTLLLLLLLIVIGAVRHWELALPAAGLLRFGVWLARGAYCSVPVFVVGAALVAFLWPRTSAPPAFAKLAAYWGAGWATIIVVGLITLALGVYSPILWRALAPAGWLALLGWLAVHRKSWSSTLRARLRTIKATGPPLFSWRSLLIAVVAIAALHGSLPPDTRDELSYHLALPQMWAFQGNWWVPSDNFHLLFPGNAELVWSWATATGGALAPRFVTLLFAVMAIGLLWHHCDRIGASPWLRDSIIACLVITPMALTSAAICYVEWPIVFFILLGWVFTRPEESVTALAATVVPAAAWAIAAGMKYTAMLFVGLLGAEWLASRVRRLPRHALAAGIALVIALAVFAAPWLTRNWSTTGDPFYPLGGTFGFGADSSHASALTQYTDLEGLWRWLPWLYHATADPIADHRLHPLWIVLHVAILVAGWRWRHELPWWTVVGATLALMPFEPAPRIYLPLLVLDVMFIPPLLMPLEGVRGTRGLITAILLATSLVSLPVATYELLVTGGTAVPNFLIGLGNRDDYLRARGAVTPVMEAVRADSPHDVRLWAWCEDRVLYFERWTRPDSPYGPPACLAILDDQGPEALTAAAVDVDFVVVRRDRCPESWERVTFEKRGWLVDPDIQDEMAAWVSENLTEVATDDRYVLYRVSRE